MPGPWWGVRACCCCTCLCPNCPSGKAACCYSIRQNGIAPVYGVFQETPGGCIYINDEFLVSLEFTATEVVILWPDGSTYRGPIPTDSCCKGEWIRVDEELGGPNYVEYYAEGVCELGTWCSSWIWQGIVPSAGDCGYKWGNDPNRTLIRTGDFVSEVSGVHPVAFCNVDVPEAAGFVWSGGQLQFLKYNDGGVWKMDIEAPLLQESRRGLGGGDYRTWVWFKTTVLQDDWADYPNFRRWAYQQYLDGTPITLTFDRKEVFGSSGREWKEQTWDYSGASVQWWPAPLLLGQDCKSADYGTDDPGVTTWCQDERAAGFDSWNSWPTSIWVRPRPFVFDNPFVQCYDPDTDYELPLRSRVSGDETWCDWVGPWIFLGQRAGNDVWGRWLVTLDYSVGSGHQAVAWRTSETAAGTGDPDSGTVIGVYSYLNWDFYNVTDPLSTFERCEGDGDAWDIKGLNPTDGGAFVDSGQSPACSFSIGAGPELDVDFGA